MAVKSKKNFFDAIDFDEIGDSMDLWWNTIHDSYQFDAISKKKEFNAVVISPPVPIGANSNEMDTFMDGVSGNFTDTLPKFVFRARLKDVTSHHVFWPDPCDPRFVEDAGGQENAIDWISKHMKVMAINATEIPKVGDTVRVKLNKQGIYTANAETAIMVGLVTSLDSIDSSALAFTDSAECRGSLSKVFDGYTPPSEFVPLSVKVASNGADFMQTLRNSGYFGNTNEFTDAFLAGLAANALKESGFKVPNPGDPVSYFEKLYKDGDLRGGIKTLNRVKMQAINSYCSWGLFQLNICGGAGVDFLKKYDYHHPLSEEKKIEVYDKLLSNGDKQMEYVAGFSKSNGPLDSIRSDPKVSAQQAGEFIATYFERCSECKATNNFKFPKGHSTTSKGNSQTLERGKIAEQFLATFNASPPPTTATPPPPWAPLTPPTSPAADADPGSSAGFDPLATVLVR